MNKAIKALLLLPLLLLVTSSCSSPSKRNLVEFTLKDGTKIQCPEPPPDVVAKGIRVKADIAAEHIGNLLKGTGGVDVDIERIRQEVPSDVSAFEVIEYRICVQYGNQVLSKDEYRSFTERILPAIQNSRQDLDTLSQLVIEGVDDPLALVPQTNQPQPPKATKFAKIKVRNTGRVRVSNVGVVVIKLNGSRDCRYQLAVSTGDTIFVHPDPPIPQIRADLNPGEDIDFDAVIECNGNPCTPGLLAIPVVDNGKRFFIASFDHDVSRLEELTVRASGDRASAVTMTFRVKKQGITDYLSLQAT